MQPFIYSVQEVNRLGQTRAKLLTRDPLLALSDWLLRAHKPLGFPPDAKASTGDLRLQVIANQMPIDDARLSIDAFFVYKGEEVRSFKLETNLATLDLDEGFTPKSAGIYQTKEYWDTIVRLRERMIDFSGGQQDVAYILALFAARDALHPFWKPMLPARGRGLGM